MNFYDLLKARSEIFGDKIFLQTDGLTMTYREFSTTSGSTSALQRLKA